MIYTKQETLNFLGRLDNVLENEGYQRKFKLYCMGGTKMVLSGLRNNSLDMDFLLSREDYRALGGVIEEMERKFKVRLDIFSDGKLPGYDITNFKENAKTSGFRFQKLELYFIDDLCFIITKALAGRPKDLTDLEKLFSVRPYPKEDILVEFRKVKFDPAREEELKKKFDEFLEIFYPNKLL